MNDSVRYREGATNALSRSLSLPATHTHTHTHTHVGLASTHREAHHAILCGVHDQRCPHAQQQYKHTTWEAACLHCCCFGAQGLDIICHPYMTLPVLTYNTHMNAAVIHVGQPKAHVCRLLCINKEHMYADSCVYADSHFDSTNSTGSFMLLHSTHLAPPRCVRRTSAKSSCSAAPPPPFRT